MHVNLLDVTYVRKTTTGPEYRITQRVSNQITEKSFDLGGEKQELQLSALNNGQVQS